MGKFFIQFINNKAQKIIIFVAATAYCLWVPYFQAADPTHYEPDWMRVGLAIPLFIITIMSYYNNFLNSNIRNIFYVFVILTATQYLYLVYRNQIDESYITGAVVLLFGMTSVIESARFKMFVVFYFMFLSLVVSFAVDGARMFHPASKSSLLIISAATVALIVFITQHLYGRMQTMLEKEISENNNLRKWSSLGQMAGGVAHEINSPLTSIYFAADNLHDVALEKKLPKEFFDDIDKIRSDAERISSIMKALRLLTKEGTKFDRDTVHLHKVCLDVIDLYRDQSKERNTQILFKTELTRRPVVMGNSQSIAQVLVNLVKNAIEAIQVRDDKWISITLSENKDSFVILVQDSGYGIPKEVQDRIFEPFYSTKDIGHGMGIGLSLSRQIAIAHGGDLIVDNTYKNTTFKLTIPKIQNFDLQEEAA